MNTKRLLTIFTVLALTFALVACSGDGGNDDTQSSARTPANDTSTPGSGGNDTNDPPGNSSGEPDTSGSGGDDPAPSGGGNDDGFIVAPNFDYASIGPFRDGVAVVNIRSSGYGGPARNQNTYTVIDENGNELFEWTDKYESISRYNCGVAIVQDADGNKGLIDKSGNEVVPIGKYADIIAGMNGEPAGEAIIVRNSDNQYGVVDTAGNEIVPIGKYYSIGDSMGQFFGGVAIVWDDTPWGFDSKCGAINTKGEEIVPLGEYNLAATRFAEGAGIVNSLDNESWGIMDTSGNFIAPMRPYDGSMTFNGFSDGVTTVNIWGSDQNLMAVIDMSGEYVIAPTDEFSYISDFHHGAAVVRKYTDTGTLVGVIDKSGNFVVPYGTYEDVGLFTYGVSVIGDLDGNKGVIDTSGNVIVELGKYRLLGYQYENGYNKFQQDDYNIVLDTKGNELINVHYTEMGVTHISEDGLAVISVGGEPGVMRLP